MTAVPLAATFAALVAVPADEALERALRERLEAARAAWPGVPLDDATFVAHLARHAKDGAPPPVAHAADLLLACACAHGVAGALAAYERELAPAVHAAIARIDPVTTDDTAQIVRESLFVGPGGEDPKIAEYAGRAPLRAWLVTVARRAALKAKRRKGDQPHDAASQTGLMAPSVRPEIDVLKRRYAQEFEEAIARALGVLDGRKRALLRLHFVEGWSIDRVAELYRIGRSTAARWIAAAREELQQAARADLCARLRLSDSELASVADAVRSALDVSLVRLLPPGEGSKTA